MVRGKDLFNFNPTRLHRVTLSRATDSASMSNMGTYYYREIQRPRLRGSYRGRWVAIDAYSHRSSFTRAAGIAIKRLKRIGNPDQYIWARQFDLV